MKTRTILATAGLATALALGAGTAAFAAGDPTGIPSTPATTATADPAKIAERCAKVPAALERLDTAQAKAETALTKLTEARTKAEADGKTRRAERLGKAIERVQQRLDRIGGLETKLSTWSASNCDA